MNRRQWFSTSLAGALAAGASTEAAAPPGGSREPEAAADRRDCDVLVYGSTPGGIAAAIEAARNGCRVLLACPKRHPGGMAASGLSTTDAVRRALFGGLVTEFIDGVRREYRSKLREDSPEWNAVDGFMEGVLWYPKKALGPAQPGQIPYGAMLPRKLDNLLVPVALSSTHIAMSVLRMEPVWMTTGQVAGLAAAVAREARLDVAQIDPEPLPIRLKIRTDAYG
jgi:heme exporter protein D